ncbi:unnamed protein product [Moneuplotes crassus]|uniref:Uncharacterized protein n=1 Tax=Euplotes crassus TaxID=5936 RepID=A0AAD1UM42_EUPCR|nr:unnamed protein product [Moneuplotes crassus]
MGNVQKNKYPYLKSFDNTKISLSLKMENNFSKDHTKASRIKIEDLIREGIFFNNNKNMEKYVRKRIKKLTNHKPSNPSGVPLTHPFLKNQKQQCKTQGKNLFMGRAKFCSNYLVPCSSEQSVKRPKSSYSARNVNIRLFLQEIRSFTVNIPCQRILSRNKSNKQGIPKENVFLKGSKLGK